MDIPVLMCVVLVVTMRDDFRNYLSANSKCWLLKYEHQCPRNHFRQVVQHSLTKYDFSCLFTSAVRRLDFASTSEADGIRVKLVVSLNVDTYRSASQRQRGSVLHIPVRRRRNTSRTLISPRSRWNQWQPFRAWSRGPRVSTHFLLLQHCRSFCQSEGSARSSTVNIEHLKLPRPALPTTHPPFSAVFCFRIDTYF